MICVLASITVKPDKKADYLDMLQSNVPHVLAEQGCIEYTPMVDEDIQVDVQVLDNCVVTIVEKWESVAHLKAHFQAPHMLTFKDAVKDMVTDTRLSVLTEA